MGTFLSFALRSGKQGWKGAQTFARKFKQDGIDGRFIVRRRWYLFSEFENKD